MDTPGTPLEQLSLFPAEKRCLKCGLLKLIEDFPRAGRIGFRARCKPCHCADTKVRQKAQRARARAERATRAPESGELAPPRTSKRCSRCNEDKPLDDFNRCCKGTAGRHSYCRDCAHAYKMEAKARRVAGALTEREQLALAGLKRCPGCGQAKPLECFSRQGRWLSSPCKECRRAQRRSPRQAEKRAALAEAERLYQEGIKRCTLCQSLKCLTEFGTHRLTADGLNWWCRACNVSNATGYLATHPQARMALAVHRHNRRARLKAIGGRLRVKDISLLYEVQRGRCAYCQGALTGTFHRDHMIPLSRGGHNEVSNIALTCRTCNLRKNARSAGAWLAVLIKERRAHAAV